MGISIHYRGSLRDLNCLRNLHHDLIRIANQSGWSYRDLSLDNTNILEFVLQLHADCEPVFLLFDSNGGLQNPVLDEDPIGHQWCAVKTQDAPIEVHVSLVRFLQYLQKNYLPDLEVIDEGGFWENDDLDALKVKRDFIIEKMGLVTNAVSEIKAPAEWKNENSIGDLVEEAILKKAELDKRKLN